MGNKTALVVDDNPDVKDFVVEALLGEGFEVTACNNAEEALDAYRKAGSFSLVISDLEMPGKSGLELIDAIHGICADVPCALMSGNHTKLASCANGRSITLLSKPFRLAQLQSFADQAK